MAWWTATHRKDKSMELDCTRDRYRGMLEYICRILEEGVYGINMMRWQHQGDRLLNVSSPTDLLLACLCRCIQESEKLCTGSEIACKHTHMLTKIGTVVLHLSLAYEWPTDLLLACLCSCIQESEKLCTGSETACKHTHMLTKIGTVVLHLSLAYECHWLDHLVYTRLITWLINSVKLKQERRLARGCFSPALDV
jgi:hypothetical protein